MFWFTSSSSASSCLSSITTPPDIRQRCRLRVDDHHHPRRGPNHHHPGPQDQGAGQVCSEEEQDARKFDTPLLLPILVGIAIYTDMPIYTPSSSSPSSSSSFLTLDPPRPTSTSIRLSPILFTRHRLRFEIPFDDLPIADPRQLASLYSLCSLFRHSSLATRNSQLVTSRFSGLSESSYDDDTTTGLSLDSYV